MVIPFSNFAPQRAWRRTRGALNTELVVAMSILSVAVLPLAYSITQESKLFRACYYRTVAMEIVDGEMEALLAGEWRSFKAGAQPYAVHAAAATNLPPGRFELAIDGKHLRLSWTPQGKDKGGKIVREATAR